MTNPHPAGDSAPGAAQDMTDFDRGYFAGYATAEKNLTPKKRMPTWLKVVLHGVAYFAVLMIGMGIGGASGKSTQDGYRAAGGPGADAPTSTTPTTTRGKSDPTAAAPAPLFDAQQEALDKLFRGTQQRGSLAHLTEDQLKTVMDTFVCKHVDDLMAMSGGGAGVSGTDAGYLWGENAVVGYC